MDVIRYNYFDGGLQLVNGVDNLHNIEVVVQLLFGRNNMRIQFFSSAAESKEKAFEKALELELIKLFEGPIILVRNEA